jgi:hypothetical protein
MEKHSRLAWAALASLLLVSQGAFAQGAGTSTHGGTGAGTGQDTSATRQGGDQQAGNADDSANANSGTQRMKGHHEGASSGHAGSAPAHSQKMTQ